MSRPRFFVGSCDVATAMAYVDRMTLAGSQERHTLCDALLELAWLRRVVLAQVQMLPHCECGAVGVFGVVPQVCACEDHVATLQLFPVDRFGWAESTQELADLAKSWRVATLWEPLPDGHQLELPIR